VQRLPEAQGTVAGGQLGIEDEPVLVAQAEQQLTPALGTLAKAVLDRQQLLAAIGIGPDQDQQALPLSSRARSSALGSRTKMGGCISIRCAPYPPRTTARLRMH
jgi:hypothetical protein